ncbi:MAG: hypothetical protein AUJ72_04505 [Candidatus Omnitrophica bacterium CG1_02_46_14]|nr:MAG: hypothetical protein AUJ72_04505 [Candidatus Omnitrophica bacterium CG1_02_46_14]
MIESDLLTAYQKETEEKTTRPAFWIYIAGVFIYSYLLFQDYCTAKETFSIFIWLRILPIILCLAGLVVHFLISRRYPRWGFIMFGMALVGTQMSVLGAVLVVFLLHLESFKFAAIYGWASLIIGSYLVAEGFKKYLWVINGIPALILVIILIFFLKIPTKDIPSITNPIELALITIVLGILDDKSRFRDFKMRKLVDEQKEMLAIEIEQRKKVEQKLETLAATDDLTGLFNRRATIKILRKYVALSQRFQKDLTLCFLDIDDLKGINDIHGHQEGDLAIKDFSDVLSKSVRVSDNLGHFAASGFLDEAPITGRIGGDEFLVILMDCNKKNAEILIRRVTDNLGKLQEGNGKPYRLSFSHGLIEYTPQSAQSVDELIVMADKLMYQNKQAKKQDKKQE